MDVNENSAEVVSSSSSGSGSAPAVDAPTPTAPANDGVHLSDDGTLAYLHGHGLIIMSADTRPKVKPTTPVENLVTNYSPWMRWGDDNLFPDYVVEEAHKTSLIPSVLNEKSNRMAAASLYCGEQTGFDEGNNPVYKAVLNNDVDLFWSTNNKNKYLQDVFRNLYWWHHAFVEIHLNDKKTYITNISVHDTAQCRYIPQNTTTGNKDYILIDATWHLGGNEKFRKTVRCLDPYYNVMEQVQSLPGTVFIYPLFFSSPLRTYYQQTPWHSVIDNWLQLSQKVPEFKTKLMDNQMNVNYIIHVPEDWWKWENEGWDAKTKDEKIIIKQATLKKFNESLTGVDKAGKSLMLTFKSDSFNTNKFTRWEVQQLKGNIGDGAYIEDSQEASTHILFALAFHPSLIGNTPGKGMGAGSGSDQRLADELFYKSNKPYAIEAAEPLNFISRYNNWKGPGGRILEWFAPTPAVSLPLNQVSPADRVVK